ncbi:MAG: cation transporter [Rhodobacteraceae bacterium]|nr:cation transporter [Paracoccaceae bacterium]MCP5342118.1 cation transporter [Paracoccaceae bacterium]
MPHEGVGRHAGHHHHPDPAAGDRKVALAVAVNLALTVAQVAGGVVSGSVALIADAMHNLSDAVALIIAFLARRIARRPATPEMSFGYGRAEVVAALVNYTTLIVISVWLGYEALVRMIDPPEVTGWIVVVLAGIALAVDLITAGLTWRLARDSMNIRAAFLHNLADAGTSVAVIVSGMMIMLYDWRLADPLITLAISGWISWHAIRETGPVIRILMLAAPPEMAPQDIRRVIEDHAGVAGVHHLHLWQLDEKRISLEAHLVLAEGAAATVTVAETKALVGRVFGITHATFEIETRASGCAGSSCGP